MPISQKINEGIQGGYSDLVNTTRSRYGGSIEAAVFLHNFVEKDTKWIHLDIAGPVTDNALPKKANLPMASGFGVRTLIDYAKSF